MTTINRRAFLGVSGMFGLALLSACSNGSSASSSSNMSSQAADSGQNAVSIGTLATEDLLPFWVAESKGLFDESGLTVNIVPFQSATELISGISSGEVELAMTDIMVAASMFAGGIDGSHSSRTDFFNFNPKWNSEYFDFLTSTGRAKVVTEGVIVAKNRRQSTVSVGTGLFYEEQTPIPDTKLNDKIPDNHDKLPGEANLDVHHGNAQTTKAANGFRFELDVTPVVTGKASILPVKVSGTSLLGWNSDGSPRLNNSSFETEIQIGNEGKDFVIGGIKRTNVIRSVSGIPFLKDIPVLGWAFSSETETTRTSELVLIARAELSGPVDAAPEAVRNDISQVVDKVSAAAESPVTNLGFQQLLLDSDDKFENGKTGDPEVVEPEENPAPDTTGIPGPTHDED